MAFLTPSSPYTRQTFMLCFITLCMGSLYSLTSLANETPKNARKFSEHEIKAAYLINFIRYVEWPTEAFDGPEAPFKIGILGSDPFGDTLDELAETQDIDGRKVTIARADDIAELKGCHLLFIGENWKKSLSPDLDNVKKLPVFSVGEQEGFTKQGGIINFVIVDTKVRFDINLKNARRSKLKISARLLKISNKVYK